MLNLPKTGSTFFRKVIKDIYLNRISKNIFLKYGFKFKILKPYCRELILPNILIKPGVQNYSDQHGVYSQIPEKERNKQIISIVRNPYDRLLSLYEFEFWKLKPALSEELLLKFLPNFPDLSVDDFVEYLMLVAKHSFFEEPTELKIGTMSLQFIKFYFKEPLHVLDKMDEEYLQSKIAFLDDIAPIKFFKQETLNEDLSCFLLKNGFSKKECDYVLNHKRVNITESKIIDRNSLLTPKVIKYIEEYEFFYINILKHYGIFYQKND